jgi:Fe(3+) dicitrate transport protein
MKVLLPILLFAVFSISLQAQVVVKGTVGILGEPLPGANVYLKGTGVTLMVNL